MNVIKRFVARFSLLLAASTLGLSLLSAPAHAGYPVAYRQAGNHWSPMHGLPNGSSNIMAWLQPGERFWMRCYIDNPNGWYNGNYWSNRWFWGQSWYHGYGYIHSSYVYYQWSVPRC